MLKFMRTQGHLSPFETKLSEGKNDSLFCVKNNTFLLLLSPNFFIYLFKSIFIQGIQFSKASLNGTLRRQERLNYFSENNQLFQARFP